MMGFGLLIPLLLIIVIVYALGWWPQSNSSQPMHSSGQTPMDVLKQRYVRGEISREEYERIREDLRR